ncbi:unnamed protein product [Blumeria hordei]|uniref:AMP-dependent synthetase/ligase domain-containing protein n=1 Tax=Blumeria hordei TaxID=2867405 RepID=A0A383UKW7_BLUHO|nr:unnamed protein product [Blumeria hordei]
MDNLLLKLDQYVVSIISRWDFLSTVLFAGSIFSFFYLIINHRDPDAHPFLLARQSHPSQVRHEGESAVFRNLSAPHGGPLNSGLNIKVSGISKWAKGKDGDLRDVWRKVVSGAQDRQGSDTGISGKFYTILGSDKITEHDRADITRAINFIGKHIRQEGGARVAIYLPNSIEFLAALFACSFYHLTAVLLTYDQPCDDIISQLKKSNADTLVVAAGSFPFDSVHENCPTLKNIIWVVDEGNKHMDWNDIPSGSGSSVNVSTWQEIIQDQEPCAGDDLPVADTSSQLKNVVTFDSGELVEYTHANIVAGISGQLAIPTNQRFTTSDLFLPIDCLSSIYPLILTLSALYSNSSVALTSVASHSPSLTLATRGISPTIIVASSETMLKFHSEVKEILSSKLYSFVHWLETCCLLKYGVMPMTSFLSKLYDRLRPTIGATPGQLRLIYISTLAGVDKPIPSIILSDLRIFTRARIIYALTSPKVAGAVSQTGIYDYRITDDPEKSHFGPPVTSLELFFQDSDNHKTSNTLSCGEIAVAGPAVVGGKSKLGVQGMMNDDLTLSLII